MHGRIGFIKQLFSVLFLAVPFVLFGQEDSAKSVELSEVFITAFRNEVSEENSMHTVALNTDSLSNTGAFTLADIIAKQPGVSLLSTGPAISKPVIRGASGNRVLVLLSGLKFDNQQWQEEHGLGLSAMGTDRVELIIGPAGLLYGSEAIGGVVNIIEEAPPAAGSSASDIRLLYQSNTLGGSIQAGFKTNKGPTWWRLRANADNFADYSDGNYHRVLNSRFKGYGLKSSWGFDKKKWHSVNHFMSSFNQFGFIFNDLYTFLKADERWSRSLSDNPAHLVFLNILSSENTYLKNQRTVIKINGGIQSNQRMENEGGGAISLNMLLLTGQYNIKWSHQINDRHHIVLSHFIVQEQNTNFGARKIVPDASLHEGNFSMYMESHASKSVILEYGIGSGEKYIVTRYTPTVNDEKKIIRPFTKFSPYYTAYTGLTWFQHERFNLKCNLATGIRVPNLAELSSNGLHEGVFVYEIGNPQLSNEQVYSANVFLHFKSRKFSFTISPFYNRYHNYIYLKPGGSTDLWYGFPKAYFVQQDANQYGAEFNLTGLIFPSYSISLTGSGMRSQTSDGAFTPYTPAIKLSPSFQGSLKWGMHPIGFFMTTDFVFSQTETAVFEPGSAAYQLVNAGLNYSLKRPKKQWHFSITGNNLLNQAYCDNLSRFKYFGLLNMGRSIMLQVRCQFN
jgi:iron complex outermembrane receptor protein